MLSGCMWDGEGKQGGGSFAKREPISVQYANAGSPTRSVARGAKNLGSARLPPARPRLGLGSTPS